MHISPPQKKFHGSAQENDFTSPKQENRTSEDGKATWDKYHISFHQVITGSALVSVEVKSPCDFSQAQRL
jgi:hypothetical protein